MNSKQMWLAAIGILLNNCFICVAGTNVVIKSDTLLPGYYLTGANGENFLNNNTDQFWKGVWKEDTNGWRVQLNFFKSNTSEIRISIEVGSAVKDSGGGYFQTPNGKYKIFELLDTNGIIVPFKKSASLALARSQLELYGIVLPPQNTSSLEDTFPKQISDRAFLRYPDGEIEGDFGFVSNGPPECIGNFKLNEVFSIKVEGDYMLAVCPVLYRYGTNKNLLDRVDLPGVTTKIHLVPSEK
jgi:hypothetical protein